MGLPYVTKKMGVMTISLFAHLWNMTIIPQRQSEQQPSKEKKKVRVVLITVFARVEQAFSFKYRYTRKGKRLIAPNTVINKVVVPMTGNAEQLMRWLNNKVVAKRMPGVWLMVVRNPVSRDPVWVFSDISHPTIPLITPENGCRITTGSWRKRSMMIPIHAMLTFFVR